MVQMSVRIALNENEKKCVNLTLTVINGYRVHFKPYELIWSGGRWGSYFIKLILVNLAPPYKCQGSGQN